MKVGDYLYSMERIYQQRDWQKIILGDIKQTPAFTENYGTTASRKHILNKSIRLMAIYSFCTAIAGFLMWWSPNYAVTIVA